MEDALAPVGRPICIITLTAGLNPCCNGRCTRTLNKEMKQEKYLNPCCNGRCTRTLYCYYVREGNSVVLILVVMEDALAPIHTWCVRYALRGLNPCCNGRCTRTKIFAVENVTPKWS